jgi:lysozyme family protein
MAFDSAVNMGVGEARRLLSAAGEGPVTQRIERMSAARAARYRALKGFGVFGAGWMHRLEQITARALADAAAAQAPQDGKDIA